MNTPTQTPEEQKPEEVQLPLQEVTAIPIPVVAGGVEEYQSSEELARAHQSTFVDTKKKEEEEAQRVTLTEKQKLHKVLDKYVKKHNSTKQVRKMAKESSRTNEYQMDLSADLVEILEKIKNELR